MCSSAAVAHLLQGSTCCGFRDALLQTLVVTSGYFRSCCLSIILNQPGHSPLTSHTHNRYIYRYISDTYTHMCVCVCVLCRLYVFTCVAVCSVSLVRLKSDNYINYYIADTYPYKHTHTHTYTKYTVSYGEYLSRSLLTS